MKLKILDHQALAILLWISLLAVSMAAQGNAFNFQGRLNDGSSPANGSYDLQFRLFNSITGGTQAGPTELRPNTTLINGVFSVNLDFGGSPFTNPNAIFIEIGVKPGGSPNAYTILGPRQQLTVVPFAVRAMNATNADTAANALNAQNSVNALTAANSSALNGLGSSNFIHNTTTTQPSSNFNISGNGVINGNLNVAGNNTIGGNAVQNRDKSGYVKAMIYVNPNGTIARCYNGITGESTGNCGYSIFKTNSIFGRYRIDFGFQVNDRFVSVTAEQTSNLSSGVNIGTGYFFDPILTGRLTVQTFITDVTFDNSDADNPFMIIVY